jgi:hypothetical protein
MPQVSNQLRQLSRYFTLMGLVCKPISFSPGFNRVIIADLDFLKPFQRFIFHAAN